jgi:hypothetical protein
VGQYILFNSTGIKIKFAIDSHDSRFIQSPEILNLSDIYFKSNFGRDIKYPDKVKPIVNGNGLLHPKDIEFLKTLRNSEKKFDFTFISRIWGGREHNIRLFEHLAKIDCKKMLLAIFPSKQNDMETNQFKARLDKAMVPWTYKEISKYELWNYLAQSRLVIIRAGKHLCIPWRMCDLLCMGASIVTDSVPYINWPVPLQLLKNFISLGINRPPNGSPAHIEEYHKINYIMEQILEQESLQQEIRKK